MFMNCCMFEVVKQLWGNTILQVLRRKSHATWEVNRNFQIRRSMPGERKRESDQTNFLLSWFLGSEESKTSRMFFLAWLLRFYWDFSPIHLLSVSPFLVVFRASKNRKTGVFLCPFQCWKRCILFGLRFPHLQQGFWFLWALLLSLSEVISSGAIHLPPALFFVVAQYSSKCDFIWEPYIEAFSAKGQETNCRMNNETISALAHIYNQYLPSI